MTRLSSRKTNTRTVYGVTSTGEGGGGGWGVKLQTEARGREIGLGANVAETGRVRVQMSGMWTRIRQQNV